MIENKKLYKYTIEIPKVTTVMTKEELSLKDVICYNLKRLRKRDKLNQNELAYSLDISRSSVNNMENGRHIISIKMLEKLCNIYGCKSSDIIPF